MKPISILKFKIFYIVFVMPLLYMVLDMTFFNEYLIKEIIKDNGVNGGFFILPAYRITLFFVVIFSEFLVEYIVRVNFYKEKQVKKELFEKGICAIVAWISILIFFYMFGKYESFLRENANVMVIENIDKLHDRNNSKGKGI
ncbi:hypothetical protein KAO73_004415 [Salmonella enterica subsp. enterica serovar Adelaide]|nr:hypothetical protein [Salmonella enterica subsp. enterica serovar Adelaide]EHJ9903728.1 hypothetical protein [Salmonella enterica subsp. enterica serovar Adelaide]